MKQCPICDTSYPDEHTTCTTDGAVLIEIREWAPGTMVRGKYRILAKIGRGGMGTVYRATHIVFEEVWALKVMAAHLAADPKFVRRFRQEAQVTRKLQHVNTVRVQDFDQAEDGSPFIVMDYIEGVSLRQLLQAVKGPLPVARALWIARGIAEGLGAAHGLGMVHRDIKPENILLARDSQDRDVPKILDFGIVAMREGSTSLSAGLLLTAAYGSPEQWHGMKSADLDGRADLYALGVTLYEMLAGRLPFHAHTDAGWMHAHLEETPAPPSQFNQELAQMAAIDNLTLKLLAKDRQQRPKDAQAFLDELNLLDAQLSWGQATVVSRHKKADLMRTLEAVKIPQAQERDVAAEIQKAKVEATAKAQAEAAKAALERRESVKKARMGLVIAAVVLVVAIAGWLFLRALPNQAALVGLGLKYEKGEGVPKDLAKAAEFYRRAAERGDAAGEFHLGTMYRDGDGVQKDPVQAADWFTRSAQQNNPDAENELGMVYQRGKGRPADDAEAVRWYRKAAEQGNPAAEYNLGWMYDNGRGISRNDELAASWYYKAAEQGNAVAQYAMAGLAKDYVEAVMWYRLAKESQSLGAQASADDDEAVMKIESQMTQEQIAEAGKRVADWKTRHAPRIQ